MDEDTNTSATNGVKFDISALEEKIIRQIEYYFGDHNLLKDKYLQDQMKLEDGWIPFETIIKFNRLKALSAEVIATALKKSPSQLMEISEDGWKIRRTPFKPLPENDAGRNEDLISRTVYIKGFPDNTTLDELLDFFKDKGNISNICMRKKMNRKDFKGSAYLTFASKEDAEQFMNANSIMYTVFELHREWKQDYIIRKQEEFEKRKELQEKIKKEREEVATNGAEVEYQKSSLRRNLRGRLLKLTGIGEGTTWVDIRDALSPYGSIAYVDYGEGELQAVVRYFAKGDAYRALNKASKALGDHQNNKSAIKNLVIQGKHVEAMVIKGEEQEEYWNKVLACRYENRTRENNKKGKKQGKGRPQFTENEDSYEMQFESRSAKRQAQVNACDLPAKQIKLDFDHCTDCSINYPSDILCCCGNLYFF